MRFRSLAILAAVAVIVLCAGTSSAELLTVSVSAPAVHTRTARAPQARLRVERAWSAPSARMHAAHRLGVHHRLHHHIARTTLSASSDFGMPRPLPARPASRPEHRAALPRLVRSPSDHNGGRTHARLFAGAPAYFSRLDVAVTPLAASQNETVTDVDDQVSASRGPPRAGPHSGFISRHFGRPVRFPRSPAASISSSSIAIADIADVAPSRARAATFARLSAAHPSFVSYQETPRGVSHARRPEGATACSFMPSFGGIRS
jgi:hypothetical protein